ncbi:hypothetical protein RB594_004116 [Gaeumannomyces avenae]
MSSASSTDHYDFISLGSGAGGKFVAWTLARDQGKRCAVIERQWVGGSCPNVACLPSKTYVQSGKVAHELSLGASYGLGAYTAAAAAAGQVRASMAEVKARKTTMVQGMVDLHMDIFRDTGVELIRGTGRFVGPKKIQIDGGRVVTADSIAICTGSTSKVDGGVPGLVEAQPLTHVGILDLDHLPLHLLVLGGGYIGLEFAQTFRRLGSEVTLVEHNAQILKREDPDVAEALAGVLAAEGVKILTSASMVQVTGRSGDSVTVTVDQQGKQHTITASHMLVATGRTPNTTDIGLETAGVELAGGAGHVKVDAQLRTTADGVFAIGDCAGSPYFTHMSFDDFRIVHDQLSNVVEARRRAGGVAGRQVPSTLFTSPELAQVGLREHEARERGVAVRVAKLPMAMFLRARTLGGGAAAVGFAKVLVEADGDGILGFAALGPSAGEMLPVVQLAMRLGAPYTEIANLIVAHPTMCEGLVQLFASVPARK